MIVVSNTSPITNLSAIKKLHLLQQLYGEIIISSSEVRADWLIIDEQLGRKIAIEHNLKITGILGILIEAKRQKLIPLVKPILDDLINIAQFWVNSSLYNRILSIVGEL